MIEVMFNGYLGYATINSLRLSSLRNTTEIAYKQVVPASEF
jgi:predicted Zn-dependent protease